MVSNINVTLFSKSYEPKDAKIVSLSSVLAAIKSGGGVKQTILDIAKTEDETERKRIKNTLPVVCFNGEFSYRSISNMEKHNGLMIVDVDHIDNLQQKRKEIQLLPYVLACFLSPSYKGIKFLVRIPSIDVENEGTLESDYIFKEYFEALTKEVSGIDPSGKDTSRACFVSYDPNIYINENATVFDKREKVQRPQNYREKIVIHSNGTSAEWALKIISDKVASAISGERHHQLYSASRLAGGYVSSGIITQEDAENYLAEAFNRTPFDESYKYRKTISDGIKNGLHYPIEDKNMKKPDYEIHPQLLPSENVQKTQTAADLMYVPFDYFEKEADELYANGNPRGLSSRFESAREFISYKIGYTTFIYSAPHSGKTQFAMSELCYLAERYGNKIAVYSKEIGEPKDVLAEVASIYIGKLYNHHDHNLRMDEAQKKRAKDFFKKHFFVIDPIYKRQTIDVTIDAILDAVKDIERIEGVHIDNVYIDPLSEVDDGGDDRIDRFTKKVNKMINDDARLNDRHNFLISHVRDQAPIVDKDSGTSWFPVPTAREVSGGQNSFKQGYQMICVYRPSPKIVNKETGDFYFDNETHVHIQKSRPKGVGRMGMFKLYYDWKTNRYYEDEYLSNYPPVFEEEPPKQLTFEEEDVEWSLKPRDLNDAF